MTNLQALIDDLMRTTGQIPYLDQQTANARTALREFLAKLPRVHVVALDGEGGWVLEHPLSCRRDPEANLTSCPYNAATMEVGTDITGRFEVTLTSGGALLIGRALPV